MKTAGLIGGTSWGSTLDYYRIMNETVNERLGGFHSSRLILNSVDFEDRMERDEWGVVTEQLVDMAKGLEAAGADFFLICTNTMHKVADDVEKEVGIPLLHIADATGKNVTKRGLTTVGLLGTRFTMEEDFYRVRLQERYGIDVIIPKKSKRSKAHDIIFDELCRGIFKKESKKVMLEIMNDLVEAGAEGVIMGCTEIPLLVKSEDVDYPLFDTTEIHACAAVDMAFEE